MDRQACIQHAARRRADRVNDCHHAMVYNMAITALHMKRNWGVAVIDGFEGMEGDGPSTVRPSPCMSRSPARTTWLSIG